MTKIIWPVWPLVSIALSILSGILCAVYFVVDSFIKMGVGGFFAAFFSPLVVMEMSIVSFIPTVIISAIILLVPVIRSYRRPTEIS